MCAIGIFAMNIIGCGEEMEDPVEAEGAIGTIGNLKIPDTAPGAPKLEIPEGIPTVKSVGYYSDWQLTKPLTGPVSKGKTIFITVEFSEGMKRALSSRSLQFLGRRTQENRRRNPLFGTRTSGLRSLEATR